MAGIVKTVIRLGVIGGLVTGAAVVVAGPHRVGAFAQQIRTRVVNVIDANIDDPVAMRAQLRGLEAQYPRRIAEVRSHLAELEAQLGQVERDRSVAERVVSLAQTDIEELGELIARAEQARSEGAYRVVNIAWDDRTLNLEAAYQRAAHISETQNIYTARVSDYDNDIANLRADAEQLEGLLAKLESEHNEFQTQIAHLERQIDAVARKERMVGMMAERQKRLDELSRYDVASVDQFKASLAKRTAELDSRLATLAKRDRQGSYEDVAKVQIDRETSARARYERTIQPSPATPEETIEIRPEGDAAPTSNGKIARSGAVVIR